MRIGINSGSIVSGVIGRKKTFWDVWGDTGTSAFQWFLNEVVNVASRMEHTGKPMKIQVSQRTYDKLAPYYEFEPRGEIEIKVKGYLQAYVTIIRVKVPCKPIYYCLARVTRQGTCQMLTLLLQYLALNEENLQ